MDSHECATIRKCSKCGADNVGRKSVWCKKCVSAYDKEIYQKKRDLILKQKKEYRANNKEKISQSLKDWRNANLDKVKDYLKKYRADNAESIKAKKREFYNQNKNEILAEKHKYNQANKEKISAKKKAYYNVPENYARFAVNREKRRAKQGVAMPAWADKVEMAKIYAKSKAISQKTGIKHHVDHIVPLNGKNVCGLHAHTNLQIITATENHRKYNNLIEDIV